MQFPGFIGGSYLLDSVNVDCQRCVNLFPQLSESGSSKGNEVASLVRVPGTRLLNTIGNGPNREFFTAANGRTFLVSGSSFYEFTDFTPIFRGTLQTSSGKCGM